ncbi:MAG TPA: YiiD C-terminal domain-containing protein [Gammaproteobacteria bacterium]|nr:YiiD C-terminal domain-containing protein [Gammaproteobacteria bacterium]
MTPVAQPVFPDPVASAAKLAAYLEHSIPLVRHMALHVASLDERALTLAAPLAPNSNHIGTAFGGSLNGLATLACWGLVWVLLEPVAPNQIVIRESRMRFLVPVTGDFTAVAPLPARDTLDAFVKAFLRRGRARLALEARVLQNEKVAAEFNGEFVALRLGSP